ncbi:MAG: hypothetical protein IJU04_01195 [Ruminococcus sp.]|nr:hypothetical protein [Ruminococcus sp.]
MTRDEILEKSRKENKGNDEREAAALAKAGQIAAFAGGMMCFVILLLEGILSQFTGRVVFAIWAVYMTITGTTLLTKYFKLKKKHELVFGLIELLLAVWLLVMYIIDLVG